MNRVLITVLIVMCLASCNTAQAPYDGDCTAGMCNGHMMPGDGSIGM